MYRDPTQEVVALIIEEPFKDKISQNKIYYKCLSDIYDCLGYNDLVKAEALIEIILKNKSNDSLKEIEELKELLGYPMWISKTKGKTDYPTDPFLDSLYIDVQLVYKEDA